jgi:hypothetical protein
MHQERIRNHFVGLEARKVSEKEDTEREKERQKNKTRFRKTLDTVGALYVIVIEVFQVVSWYREN